MLGSGAQLGGGAEGPLRVILVRYGQSEDSEDGVTAQLGHRPPVARAHGSGRVVVPSSTARRDSGSRSAAASGRASCEQRHVTRRRTSGPTDVRSADGPSAGAGAGTSWRRISPSSARSWGEGSMPSPSTSARWALAVRRQCVRLAPGVIQGEHELAPQSLAKRVLTNERLKLAGHLNVPSACEVGIHALFEAGPGAGRRAARSPAARSLRRGCRQAPGHARARAPLATPPPPPAASP